MSQFRLRESWPWLVAGIGFLVLLWLLAPILTPFVLGAGLAYVGDPIVDRLQTWRLSRTAGVCVVFVAITSVSLLAVVLLLPMLQVQLATLLSNIPDWLLWLQDKGLTQLGITLPEGVKLDADGLKTIARQHWSEAGDFLRLAWAQVSESGVALATSAANLLLVPVVTFYLLRDWDDLVAWTRNLIPPRYVPRADQMAHETDEVLSAFFRGQLSVMAALSLYYWLALWIVGLDLALLVGLIVGVISFVPYLGTIVGILTAAIAMLVQTQDPLSLIWIAVVFGIGQVLESNVLTPWLVGDKIGLHPVTVIFAIMAGGQLFGFIGIMLALPVSAVLSVLMRHFKDEWLKSQLYLAGKKDETSEATEPSQSA
ncbi:MAG: AI-2E family transporter [Panacagrimonas sp.]